MGVAEGLYKGNIAGLGIEMEMKTTLLRGFKAWEYTLPQEL